MKNKMRDQLKNLVAINAAIKEAGEEIEMLQKETIIYEQNKKYVSALNELKQKVIYYRYQKIKIFAELYDKIEALEDEQEKRLLKYRYIKGFQWEEIADKMGYSTRQVFNIHKMAMLSLDFK